VEKKPTRLERVSGSVTGDMRTGWKQRVKKQYKLIKCRRCGAVFKCFGPVNGKPQDCWAWRDASSTEPLPDRCLCPKCLDDFHDICRFGGYVEELYRAKCVCLDCGYSFDAEGTFHELLEMSCPECGSDDIGIEHLERLGEEHE